MEKVQLKIAACVVLYNPESSVYDNIKSYQMQLDLTIIVDNSTSNNEILIKKINDLKNIIYISNKRNLGLAKGLNIALKKALEYNFDFAILLDQDSTATPKMIENMLNVGNKYINWKKTGILCPVLVNKVYNKEIYKKFPVYKIRNSNRLNNKEIEEIFIALTSGSLIHLKTVSLTGFLTEKLFVDYVDIEYSLRLRKMGFKIYQVKTAYLKHNIGLLTEKFLFLKKINVLNHSPFRKYLITRNRFYVTYLYKSDFLEFYFFDKFLFFLDFLKVLFFEMDKKNKIKMIFIGWNRYKKMTAKMKKAPV